jgi:hypothetical protein
MGFSSKKLGVQTGEEGGVRAPGGPVLGRLLAGNYASYTVGHRWRDQDHFLPWQKVSVFTLLGDPSRAYDPLSPLTLPLARQRRSPPPSLPWAARVRVVSLIPFLLLTSVVLFR